MADKKPKAPPRTKAEIGADLAEARSRLSGNVEELIDQVHPNRIKQRQIAGIKQLANTELESAKAQVINSDGSLRTDRLAIAGGALAGLITFILVIRKILNRNKVDNRTKKASGDRKASRSKKD